MAMAVKSYVITCDHCEFTTDEYGQDADATEAGWYIVWGPERILGGTGELAFCSADCLEAGLL